MPRPNQINLDQAAHCHGSNFNVSSSPNQHSYQLDQFFFIYTWLRRPLVFQDLRTAYRYSILINTEWKEASPTHLARQTHRPSQRAQSQLSTSTAASNTSLLSKSLAPPRMEPNHWRTLYWLAVPDYNICDEYFEIIFCFCSLCHISCVITTYCYFQLLIYRHP